ncbi:hypothetical protein [Bradyrhizobium lablabi]|uniref:hypothetical protein n=1 Tax=Bradyrhizobium lablabi TaxID=722472 RepID=UPI001BA959E2|nr:hypothetical protein [Bradyrhizobium lablabi]MBR0696927.1 hypothetical protein [Bradyrhizobium lablabi]
MNTDISRAGSLLTWRLPRSWMPGITVGVAVSALAVHALIEAPAMRRTAERLRAEQIQQEDREYCTKFQMPPGNENFAACVTDLAEIRRRQRERSAAETAGVL